MSKKKKDDRQLPLGLSFEKRVDAYLKEKQEILNTIHNSKPPKHIESYSEACIELAVAVKKAIRHSGLSREEVSDEINKYFGWPTAEEVEKMVKDGIKRKDIKHLSFHMLNHHLSKPEEYPIEGALLYAIHHVTGSLEPCKSFAESEAGDVIYKEDKDDLVLGKMEKAIYEMQKLKKELKGK